MKIAVIGYSGSGKSTLSSRLGERYGLPVLHLDRVQFTAGWVERDREDARALVAGFMAENVSWVIDGNYREFYQRERFDAADRIIFLDFSRFACLFRAYKRYRDFRGRTRESMADGCAEKMDLEFVRWILLDGRVKVRLERYRAAALKYAEKWTRIKNQRQLDRFLLTLQ